MKTLISSLLIALIGLSSGLALANPMDKINLSNVRNVTVLIYDANRDYQNADRSKFRLAVWVNGVSKADYVTQFTASVGKLIDNPERGKEPELTPEGVFYPSPGRLYEEYTSNQFGGRFLGIFETGGMPFSIFFHNGFAIHGSRSTVNGKPASKGCVRLRVRNAERLFKVVKAAIRNTGSHRSVRIEIRDTESNYVAVYRGPEKDPNNND